MNATESHPPAGANAAPEPERLIIFDTTLRDGEQCPGASMNLRQKIEVARALERLRVDVIEAGFPVISAGDFEAVQAIARETSTARICGLARCVPTDIEAAAEAVKPAGDRGRVHVFLATSKIHRQHKLRKAQEEILRLASDGVRLARSLCADVEFSPEDASRTEPEFLAQVVEAAIAAGARTVNIPDTVGWAVPEEYAALIRHLREHVPNIADAVISVHCHDDMGLACANTLAAIRAGARQVEGTINGIGERAGNAALEEVVMALRTRGDFYSGLEIGMDAREIVRASRTVARMSGLHVARNKAIVGENAFAHSSGIHQDGILKRRDTYEIMDPRDVGWGETELPLTKHSGRAAVAQRLERLGRRLSAPEMDALFARFKEVGDRKKFVYDDDLSALADDSSLDQAEEERWELTRLQIAAGGDPMIPTATVELRRGDETLRDSATGNGAVDASMKAIDRLLGVAGHLVVYQVEAVTEGKDALGETTIKADFGDGTLIAGQGASTDVVESGARAYLAAVNRHLARGPAPEGKADATPGNA